ncbi:MAG TPA: lipase [Thermomonospora sp.]|nr:lipase [Thermomonospora sp.]
MRSVKSVATAVMVGAAVLAGAGAVPSAAGAERGRAAFELPAPGGRWPVGTAELHLVDEKRPDPWVAGRTRELMVGVWYPAAHKGGDPAPYLRPAAARLLDQSTTLGLFPPGTVDWAGARTHAAESAPVDTRKGARPVVLYSPGFGVTRALGTTLAEELASHGYVVVTVDHTYETMPVEFPGGRVEVQRLPPPSPQRTKKAVDVRVQDTRFVLDRLAALRNGANPDAEGRPLPSGLGRVLDLTRVGMVGHSAGGVEALETMRVDRRLDAGVDMDGTLQYDDGDLVPVAGQGLRSPFMLMGAATGGTPQTHRTSPSWESLWTRSTGWKRDLNAPTAGHYSSTDLQAILPDLDRVLDIPAADRADFIGTVPPARMIAAQRAYVTAFFDRHLRGRPEPILNRPSPRFPDVHFVR